MDLLGVYQKVVLIRAFESKLDFLFKKGLINGTAHFCIGQEFVPVIVSQYLADTDTVTSTHRGHGHALAKGLDPKKVMAELLGRIEGYNSGKGGSQHIISEVKHFIANGISGGMVPIATGIAFANKYRKTGDVAVAYLGDGAFNEGYVQESLNMAKVLSLPIIFVCENNQYAMSTPFRTSHSAEMRARVAGMGITCASIPDNDFALLDRTAKEFISAARKSPEPYFIEVKTYRHLGHSKNDKNLYRNADEDAFWFAADAVPRMRGELLKAGLASDEELASLESATAAMVDKIADEVVAMPSNERADLEKDVFA